MKILAMFNTIVITMAIFVLPLICIIALIIMSVKRLPEYDDEKKARLMKLIRNTSTGVLILNYTLDIVVACELIFNILEAFNISTSTIYAIEIFLSRFYFVLGVVLAVSALILFCNMILVAMKKTDGSWKRTLIYFLICLLAVLYDGVMCFMLIIVSIGE